MRWFLLLSMLLVLYRPGIAQAASIGVADDVLADYKTFLSEADTAAEQQADSLQKFNRPAARRDVVEIVIAIKALRLGGYDAPVTLLPMPNYGRLIQQLEIGDLDMTGSGVWKADLDTLPGIEASQSLIPNGQFFAGFYMHKSNPMLQQPVSPAMLLRMRGVSNQHWVADWKALQSLPLKGLYHATKWQSMVRMVGADRADFLLAPFQRGSDMALYAYDQTLLPLRGMKISLPGNRVLAISMKGNGAAARRKALDTGLEALIENGTLRKAYKAAGMYPAQTEDWYVVNAPDQQ